VSKVRVYELARETGLPNKEVVRRLDDLGIEAKSHSSTVTEADASRFRDSLGRSEAKKREAEERARREAEQYDLEELTTPPTEAKARRILPPHLREQQQPQPAEQEQTPAATSQEGGSPRARPAAQPFRPDQGGGVSFGGEEPAAAAAPEASPQPAQPAEAEPPQAPAAAWEAAAEQAATQPPQGRPDADDMTQQGLVRPAPEDREPQRSEPAEESQGTPGVPRPGTPPRPGQPIRPRPSSAASGQPVHAKRRVEPDLPKEGSGRRSIPPPVRPAPAEEGQPQRPAESPGRTPSSRDRGGGRGRPADGGRPGGGPPGGPGGGPSGPGGPGGPGGAGRGKKKKGKKRREPTLAEQFEEQETQRRSKQPAGPVTASVEGPVDVMAGITVTELAHRLGVNPTDIVRVLFSMGEMVTVTQSLSEELVEYVAAEMGAEVNFVTEEQVEFGSEEPEDPADLVARAPVVTVMGHVDHGKTKLLDAIRSADVASGEAGGITQHIGAYQVTKDDREITFIDTPGHEAFTQMRARGASVTDVAILVVAADDGVMPQTVEAINHAKAAEVPIIVAINKVDKEGADPARVRTELTEHELIAEELGGQTTTVEVSATASQGIDELLEMILLQADVMELAANPDKAARGAVVEAHLDRGRGPVASVLLQAGTLRVGDSLVAGTAHGRIRAMIDDTGTEAKQAGPSEPVQLLGMDAVPEAGQEFRVVEDERAARDIAERRAARERQRELAEQRPSMSLEDLSGAIAEGQQATLNLIVKADVAGSAEAVADAMTKLELPEEVKVRIVHKGAGAVTENDVRLAETTDAIIIAFNVRPETNARRAIEESGVDLRHYSVIYKAVEDVEAAVKGMLEPEIAEEVIGRVQVRELFRVRRVGTVAGCHVTEGKVTRHAHVRVLRDGVVVAQDVVDSLKRFTEDVTEVGTNYECGIGLAKFGDLKVGDEFEAFQRREIART
jgi:translation initiation factor IF-2